MLNQQLTINYTDQDPNHQPTLNITKIKSEALDSKTQFEEQTVSLHL